MRCCEDRRVIRLQPETLAKLHAVAETMGCTVDRLIEKLVLDMLPTIEHEDLLDAQEAP